MQLSRLCREQISEQITNISFPPEAEFGAETAAPRHPVSTAGQRVTVETSQWDRDACVWVRTRKEKVQMRRWIVLDRHKSSRVHPSSWWKPHLDGLDSGGWRSCWSGNSPAVCPSVLDNPCCCRSVLESHFEPHPVQRHHWLLLHSKLQWIVHLSFIHRPDYVNTSAKV